MNTLTELGIIKGKENFEGNTSLYQHILNNIRENDYDKSVLSQEFVIELHGLVTLLRSRHEAVPPDKISTQQFYHILTFLVCRIMHIMLGLSSNSSFAVFVYVCICVFLYLYFCICDFDA